MPHLRVWTAASKKTRSLNKPKFAVHGSVNVEIHLLMEKNASYFHHSWGNDAGLVKIRAWRNRSGSSSNPHWNNEGNKFESLFASIARYWTPLVCTWEDGMIIQNTYVKHLCVLFLHSRMDLKRPPCDRIILWLLLDHAGWTTGALEPDLRLCSWKTTFNAIYF